MSVPSVIDHSDNVGVWFYITQFKTAPLRCKLHPALLKELCHRSCILKKLPRLFKTVISNPFPFPPSLFLFSRAAMRSSDS